MSEEKPQRSVFELALDTKYNLDDESIKELSFLYMSTEKVSGRVGDIYLRTLINRTKDAMLPSVDAVAALEHAERPMYEAVKAGALTSDIQVNTLTDTPEVRANKAKEHNRRTTWARTIKSELKGLLKSGFDINKLDVATITKKDLRPLKIETLEASGVGAKARPDSLAMAMALLAKADAELAAAVEDGFDLLPAKRVLKNLLTKYA